jgi:hypothetical protein
MKEVAVIRPEGGGSCPEMRIFGRRLLVEAVLQQIEAMKMAVLFRERPLEVVCVES